jgi:NitT/TauT family transport system permease protein
VTVTNEVLTHIAPVADPTSRPRLWVGGAAAGALWLGAAALTAGWPDADDWAYTRELAAGEAALGLLLLLGGLLDGRPAALFGRVRSRVPWLIVLALVFALWEGLVAKLNLLPRPFFAPPQAFLEVYLDDGKRLAECAFASFGLLATGYLIGAAAGFVAGVSIGWSRSVAYWGHPILRLIGPLPATAWLPIAFFAFPSSWSASVFLIALASAIPVTVLTWSGVAGVNSAYYDIARTLGASPRFLVLRVAVPAAMPHVFVGLFMGLCMAFSVLVVAEMVGVKVGLGWYLQWAQGWAAYGNMYAALLVLALVCSSLVGLLFRVRDRVLVWQKGLLKW